MLSNEACRPGWRGREGLLAMSANATLLPTRGSAMSVYTVRDLFTSALLLAVSAVAVWYGLGSFLAVP